MASPIDPQQLPATAPNIAAPSNTEDCVYLNVYMPGANPQPGAKRPT